MKNKIIGILLIILLISFGISSYSNAVITTEDVINWDIICEDPMYIPTHEMDILNIILIINIILGLLSIIFIVKAVKKSGDKKIFIIWLIAYIASIAINAMPKMMISYGGMLYDRPRTFGEIFWDSGYIFYIIAFVIRIFMILYPICIIRRNENKNKSLKGEK